MVIGMPTRPRPNDMDWIMNSVYSLPRNSWEPSIGLRSTNITKKTKTDNRFTKHEMPDWAHVFVFGSALHSNAPKDLDLLVVYDPAGCPPNEAREKAELLASIIGQKSGLCPHVVVLSI